MCGSCGRRHILTLPESDQFRQPPSTYSVSSFSLLRRLQGIIDLEAKISDGAFKLSMSIKRFQTNESRG
jgi:hypothetical protein